MHRIDWVKSRRYLRTGSGNDGLGTVLRPRWLALPVCIHRAHALRQGVADAGEYGQPLVQADEPQQAHQLRLGCEEAMAAAGLVGVVGRSEPTR